MDRLIEILLDLATGIVHITLFLVSCGVVLYIFVFIDTLLYGKFVGFSPLVIISLFCVWVIGKFIREDKKRKERYK